MSSNYLANLILCLLVSFASIPRISAQADPVDSLRRILFNKESSPEQRKKARDGMFQIQRKRDASVYRARPQQILLQDAKRAMNDQKEIQDSIFEHLIKLASVDTLADIHEKMEAIRFLANWVDNVRPKQDSIVDQLINLASKDTLTGLAEKKEAVRLLARTRNNKAYAFLLDNIGHLSTTDDYNNTDYWFVNQEPIGNWVLFPEIIRLMSTKKLEFDEGMVTVTLLLDRIVKDPPLLIAILNLYAQKEQNEVFFENKKNIVQLLQDMH
ncbi:MAG: hypothetical protein ACKVUS_17585 [Saprospiraceae bacterium]